MRPRSTALLAWLVAVGGLFLLSGALDRAVHALGGARAPLPPARAIVIPFFAAALGLLAAAGRETIRRLAPAWPQLLLVGLATLSALWSPDPRLTLLWAAGLAGATGVGALLALRFDADRRLDAVVAALGLALLASLVAIVACPDVGMRATRRGVLWLGIFEDNNLFGRAMSLAAIAAAALAVQCRRAW